jgi:hypothetical protein
MCLIRRYNTSVHNFQSTHIVFIHPPNSFAISIDVYTALQAAAFEHLAGIPATPGSIVLPGGVPPGAA